MDFAQLAELCAPSVASSTLRQIASVESDFKPFAIGVVGGRLARPPRNRAEALATAEALKAGGWNYSLGLIQVNQANFPKYGLTNETALDPCSNLRVGSEILTDCYKRAGGAITRTGDALSCYYTGNFRSGYRLGYVAKVADAGSRIRTPYGVAPIAVIAAPNSRHARATARAVQAPAAAFALVSTHASPVGATDDTYASTSAKAAPTALLF